MSDDWFRNSTWNDSIEQSFNDKLRRARRKEQYLRIQASMLAPSHPDVSLKLLERYFELPDDFDHAQAYVDRAAAFLTLGRVNEALAAYEDALAREAVFPRLLTSAYVKYPYLVAVREVHDKYPRALELLHLHESRLVFPVDRFCWHAAHSLIALALGDAKNVGSHASQALVVARGDKSGFRYHPSVGLVTPQYDDVIRKLAEIGSA